MLNNEPRERRCSGLFMAACQERPQHGRGKHGSSKGSRYGVPQCTGFSKDLEQESAGGLVRV